MKSLALNGELLWTQHAEERQQQWEQQLSITRQEVEAVVINPEQIIPDDEGVLVAQSRRGNVLLRVSLMSKLAQLSAFLPSTGQIKSNAIGMNQYENAVQCQC